MVEFIMVCYYRFWVIFFILLFENLFILIYNNKSAFFGSIFGGWVSNKIGRKKTLLLFDSIIILGFAITVINNFFAILIGRLIMGIASN